MLVASVGLDKQLGTEPEECASADFDWRDSNDRMTPDSVSGREAPLDLGEGARLSVVLDDSLWPSTVHCKMPYASTHVGYTRISIHALVI